MQKARHTWSHFCRDIWFYRIQIYLENYKTSTYTPRQRVTLIDSLGSELKNVVEDLQMLYYIFSVA